MYTGFRQKVENQTVVRKLISLPRQMNPLPQCVADDVGDIPSIEELGASGTDMLILYPSDIPQIYQASANCMFGEPNE